MNLHRILQISKGLPPDSLHYMIFARKLSASPTETVTISGYPCVLENSVEKPVVDYRIYGNTVQNGTPSPDNPVEIQSVGDLVTDGEYAGKYKIPVVASTENNVPKTTNIYLDEPLRKIGDYADIIDFERGGVERKIGQLVLTGEENQTIYNYNLFNLDLPLSVDTHPSVIAPLKCSHYITCTQGDLFHNRVTTGVSAKTGRGILFSHDGIMTTDDFKSYLAQQYEAGIPVTVYYALAESRTETLILPQLPTLNGTTIITTDTEIKPSDIKITYKARKSK